MERYYDPQLTIDVYLPHLSGFRSRFGDHQRVVATDSGSRCFFPSVLGAGLHFPTE
jgi:hypothetical protein